MDQLKKRILVVDDEPDLLKTAVDLLESEGYEVLSAHDGQEGLEKARREKPDLILLDVLMPKLNGYQVCRALKGGPETQSIPVIMLTSKAQEIDKFWGKETGADDYVTKPYEIEDLLARAAKFLKKD